mmetsp:Transcript_11703/g.26338  ORF Transcript_11703/g.26338 Transcript_11703/m.26338 type:complete len:227 (+) Transcript_11703:647-1327(+)
MQPHVTFFPGLRLSPREQLDLELERCAAGDLGRRARLAIGVVGAAEKLGLLALVHRRNTLVPPLDHLSITQGEFEVARPVARGVKLAPVREERAHVVHLHLRAGGREAFRRVARHEDPFAQASIIRDVDGVGGDAFGRLLLDAARPLHHLCKEAGVGFLGRRLCLLDRGVHIPNLLRFGVHLASLEKVRARVGKVGHLDASGPPAEESFHLRGVRQLCDCKGFGAA